MLWLAALFARSALVIMGGRVLGFYPRLLSFVLAALFARSAQKKGKALKINSPRCNLGYSFP